MIEHIVLFKWKETTTQIEKDQILLGLSQLKDKIPGIINYKIGHNESTRNQGYGAGLTSTFVDKASLDAYLPHPEHQKIYNQLIHKVDSLLVVDFQDISKDQ